MNERIIKFRAWHKDFKEMLDVYEMKFATNGIYLTPGSGPRINHDYIVDYEVVLMQFTGLKDKNGKEVFEGDILQRYVVLSTGSFGDNISKHDKVEVTFSNGRFGTGESSSPIVSERSEVIGNIYSNPELLQKGTPE